MLQVKGEMENVGSVSDRKLNNNPKKIVLKSERNRQMRGHM